MGFNLGSTYIGVSQEFWLVVGALVVLAIWMIVSRAAGPVASREEPRDDRYPRRLDRSRRRAIGGVCRGIAQYFGWQVGTTRAGFLFLAIFSGGFTVVLVYLVLWRVMPLEPMPQPREFSLSDYQVD